MARLSVSLFVGLADVTLQAEREDTPFVEDYAGVAHCSWILSDVPTDFATLQAEVASVLTQCGCGRARHLSALIAEELTRLVTNACADRESRLSMLPTAAPFRWNELPPTPPWIRHGVYSVDACATEVNISYEALEPGKGIDGGRNGPVAFLASTTPEPGRAAQLGVSLDGLCAVGVVQTLETWGWARQMARLRLAVPSRSRHGLTGSRCCWKYVEFMKAGLA